MKTYLLRNISLLLLIAMLFSLPVYAENDKASYAGGTITVSGTLDTGLSGKNVIILALKAGKTADDYYNITDPKEFYTVLAHFGMTTSTEGGNYTYSFKLSSEYLNDTYTIIVDSLDLDTYKELTVEYVSIKRIEEAIEAINDATTANEIVGIIEGKSIELSLDTTDFVNFSNEKKEEIAEKFVNQNFDLTNLESTIPKMQGIYYNAVIPVVFANISDQTNLEKSLILYNDFITVDKYAYDKIIGKNDFITLFKASTFTDIKSVEKNFIETSLITLINKTSLSGEVKLAIEKYSDMFGINVNGDYKSVEKTKIYNLFMKERPLASINSIGNKINELVLNNLTQSTPKPPTKPGGGGGGGGDFVVEPTQKPVETPKPTPTTTPEVEEKVFKDIETHWAKKEIIEMNKLGYIKGVTVDEFIPDVSITRAEVATIIARILNLPITEEEIYSDVQKDSWYFGYVNACANAGIISKEISNFRPDESITREEISKIIIEAYKISNKDYKSEEKTLEFADNSEIEPWAVAYISDMIELGIIKGVEIEGKLYMQPKANASRAETAVMLSRLLEKIK